MISKYTHKSIDVDDNTINFLKTKIPDLLVNERKDGEDIITYEDVVTPQEHTYTTIERVQTGTKTVFDSSSETFGWSNIQYKNYEIVDEPNTNNGRKMYVAHLTAQLSDGITHDLEYRLTFPPSYLNSYNLSGGYVWLQDKTNWIVPIYVELFDKTDNKTLQGDINIVIKDLDNAKGNFSGMWEGIALASGSSFVSASYGEPKKHTWHNQEWYSGNNNNPGVVGGDITIKVNLREGFTHAFDYALVNGSGYSASFGVQDLNLANMTKVTTTSHEVPVFEDREVTHTETIDIHSTVEHVTPAPIIKSVVRHEEVRNLKIYGNDCESCEYVQLDSGQFSRYGWLNNDNQVSWGEFVSNKVNFVGIDGMLSVNEYGQLNEFKTSYPFLLNAIYYPNLDKSIINANPYSNVTNMTMESHVNNGANYIFTYTFNADYQGVQHDMELVIRVPETLASNPPAINGLSFTFGWKIGKDVLYEMQLFDKTLNANVTGDVEFDVEDVDNQFGNFTKDWEGVKPTSNTKFMRSTRAVRIKNGYYSSDRATSGTQGSAGDLTFKTTLSSTGFTPIYIYKLTSPTNSEWYTGFSPDNIRLDNIITEEIISSEDNIDVYLYQCCKSSCCSCGKDSVDLNEFETSRKYIDYCETKTTKFVDCHYETTTTTKPDLPCGEKCKDCWRLEIIKRFSHTQCIKLPNYSCNIYRYDFYHYNYKELKELLTDWLYAHESEVKNFFKTFIFDGRKIGCDYIEKLPTIDKTVIGSINEMNVDLRNKVDSLNVKLISNISYQNITKI